MNEDFIVRKYQNEDFDTATILWRIARERSLPDFQREKGHFFYEDRAYFRHQILKKNEVWVVELKDQIISFIAMEDDFIDQLFVHPDHWRCGVGSYLLKFAKERSPEHLWLYTLQVNITARAFYEKNGFKAEKFGISPAPESEPDVEYHWRRKK